ncbi:MAG: hypothetical protein IPM57_00465 [Oligoflexia bacterium]|nr:hypothetical protein [Oligoflexia bacterium]
MSKKMMAVMTARVVAQATTSPKSQFGIIVAINTYMSIVFKFKANLALVSVLLLVTLVPQFAQAHQLSELQKACSIYLKKAVMYLDLLRDKNPKEGPTVRVMPSLDGGYVFIRKPNQDWDSFYKESKNDVQGDPRKIIETTGQDFAKRLGFELLDENTMLTPSFKKINQKLDELNELPLFKEMSFNVRFYESKTIAEDMTYLRHFVDKAMIPISAKDSIMLHDYSYHLAFFLAPERIVRHIQNQVKLGLLFIEYLEKYKKQIPPETIEVITKAYAQHLDVLTGIYGLYFRVRGGYVDAFYIYSPITVFNKLIPEHPALNKLKQEFAEYYRFEPQNQQSLSEEDFNEQMARRQKQLATLQEH